MNTSQVLQRIALAVAILAPLGCKTDTPRVHESLEREGSTPKMSEPPSEDIASKPESLPNSPLRFARIPTTFAEWRAMAPVIKESGSQVRLGRTDYATQWIILGDSVAVGFDRGINAVLIASVRAGTQQRVGRAGRGPLEFSAQATLGRWSGDSVVVIDRGLLRATILNVQTRTGRAFSFVERDTSSEGEPLASLGEHRIVFRSRAPNLERGIDGMYRGLQVLRIVEANAEKAIMSATVLGEAGIRAPFGGGRVIGNAPVALAPFVTVGRDEVWWIPGGTDSLFAMGRSQRRLIGRVRVPVKRLTRAEKSRLADAHLSKFANSPEVAAAIARVLVIPDSISLLGALWAGEGGSLWFRITDVDVRDVGSVWIQARPDASIVQCFFIPPEKRILAFGDSIALVATRDPDDETYGIAVTALQAPCPIGKVPFWK